MKVLTPGHRYELDWFEQFTPEQVSFASTPPNATVKPDGTIVVPGQVIQFIQKEKRCEPDCAAVLTQGAECDCQPKFVTIYNGTTNEEVLAMIVDRLQSMNAKLPCRENAIATTHIETAILWLNKRTAERKARGVEGTPKP